MENENQPQKKKWYERWWVITLFAIILLLAISAVSKSGRQSMKQGFEAGSQR